MCMFSLVWDVACWCMLALRKAWHFSEGLRTATQKPLTVRATMSRNTQDPHGGTAVQKPCRLCVCDTTGIPPQFPWKLQPVTGTLKRFLSTCRAEVLSCCYRICSELYLSSSKHVQTKHSNLALKFWIWIPGVFEHLETWSLQVGHWIPHWRTCPPDSSSPITWGQPHPNRSQKRQRLSSGSSAVPVSVELPAWCDRNQMLISRPEQDRENSNALKVCMVFEKRLGPGEKKCDWVDLSSVEFP